MKITLYDSREEYHKNNEPNSAWVEIESFDETEKSLLKQLFEFARSK